MCVLCTNLSYNFVYIYENMYVCMYVHINANPDIWIDNAMYA